MSTPLDVLQQYWGYQDFRPLQLDIIQSVLDNRDTLALMPTGGGKSICFQVPALCKEGICIVVSPLIALMKDQVEQLQQRGIAAIAIFAGMHYKEIDRELDNCVAGLYKFLYVSPERLQSDLFQARLAQMQVNLFAIDEAHCISQWGYDFRPAYLNIQAIRSYFPEIPVLAVTATATPKVVIDIQEKLEFKTENVFQKSFSRSNLSYVVIEDENKRAKMMELIRKIPGSGVIYVRNRRKTRELAIALQQHNIAADFYHAGLDMESRNQKQEAWINNQIRIIVATNAFGMGIDKADVRLVIHWEIPDSLEAYFQEAGRAGRDGKDSFAVLLYHSDDKERLEENYIKAFPNMKYIRQVYRALGSYLQLAVGSGKNEQFDFDLVEFANTFQFKVVEVLYALKILEQSGWLSLSDAVFQAAQMQIKTSREGLYDFTLRHPKLGPVIKAILRNYQGAFNQTIYLKESKLAKYLKISLPQLQKQLRLMAQASIIQYQPQKEKPQLTLLQERVSAENLLIDQELYKFRKKQYAHRIQKAVQYAEIPICRSMQLLQYFGEKNAKPCGKCDICRGRIIPKLSKERFSTLKNEILELINNHELTPEALFTNFEISEEDNVKKVLQFLLSEELVFVQDGIFQIKKASKKR
ncbi:MAG: ATP-dependent DNA helicase RecQ [Bacteroidota bacterium]